MRIKGNLIVFSVILLFCVGLALGLTGRQNNYHTIPKMIKYDSPNNQKIKYHASINEDNNDQISVNPQKDQDAEKAEDNYSPDLEYYKKARQLQQQFPDTFIMSSQTQLKRIALTFDDGPDNKTTPKILDILDQYNVPATFFVVGKNVERHPTIAKRMIDEGHQVANHSWSHLRPTELTDHEYISEVIPVEETLTDYFNSSMHLYYRPPYGLLTPTQIDQIRKKGYLVISWSIDSLDWAVSNPEKIRDKVIDSVHPGAIVLMHSAGGKDSRLGTVKALPEIIDNLAKQGYEFVTVQNLINGG